MLAFTLIRGPRAGDRWARTRVVWCRHAHEPPFDPRGILCIGCGYELTGNTSGRRPECERPIDVPAPAIPQPMDALSAVAARPS
ncbi:MAG: hypothetical protein L6Q92_06925 [Phycisphaerae bacterium]|nr:hypothetical protein [Phycisphaerae bacterium]